MADDKIVEAVAQAYAQAVGWQIFDAEHLKGIRAAITAYQAEAWQDISTADKGAGWVLLFSTSEGQDVGRWEPTYGEDGDWMDAQGYTIWNVTHWHPLPPPPKASP